MNVDHVTYRIASRRSLLGLVMQGVFALALLLYSIYSVSNGSDHGAMTAAIFASVGVIVWITLLVVYDQRRRERLEAVEIEAMSESDSLSASAFSGTDEELRVASRRLKTLEKWLIPGVGIVCSLLLLGFGVTRLIEAQRRFDPDVFVPPGGPGWALAIGLAVGVGGFIYARFLSGMAKQTAWTNLRAGAAFLVGTSLFGIAIAVAHFLAISMDNELGIRVVQVALPIAMIVFGVEMALYTIGGFYSAQRPGEQVRTPFELKTMSLVASPDRVAESISEAVSYQFGVNVSETWFVRLLRRWWAGLVLFALVVGWLMTSLVVVAPNEKGMILRNGRVVDANGAEPGVSVGPGLHLKAPWPIGELYVPGRNQADDEAVGGVRVAQIGSAPAPDDSSSLLWDRRRPGDPGYFVVPTDSAQSSGLDTAVVLVESPVQYRVGDVEEFEQIAQDGSRARLLELVGRRAALNELRQHNLNEFFGGGIGVVGEQLRASVRAAFANVGERTGSDANGAEAVDVLFVGIGGVQPPVAAVSGFEDLVRSQQARATLIAAAEQTRTATLATVAGSEELAMQVVERLNEIDRNRPTMTDEELAIAEQEVQEMLEEAGGSAGIALQTASADRWEKHMGERANAAAYAGLLAGFEAAPRIVKWRTYFESLAELMTDSRLYVVEGDLGGVQYDMKDAMFGLPDATNLELGND